MLSISATSIYWFTLSSLLPVFIYAILLSNILPQYPTYQGAIISVVITYLAGSLIIFTLLKEFCKQVANYSSFLGTVFSIGIFVSVLSSHSWAIFGWYMCFMAFFHYSEFLIISIANPSSLSIDSFMLNHSYAYGIAVATSWVEYFIEQYFIPDIKDVRLISIVGFMMCIFGEAIRKTAILTASTNFHHIVQTVKHDNHVLVTHGIYSLCRHPGYFGWFYWCIGTQLILVNPICTVAFTLIVWKFFQKRIISEEISLLNFFKVDYVNYKKKVPTGIPFIHGYNLQ